MTPSQLTVWLGARTRVLDGAVAGELLRRGVAAAGRLWGVGALMEAPEAVNNLHRDYIAAGAEAITANTFRVAPYSLRKMGLESQARSLAFQAVDLARAAARESGALVLASQTTLEDCYCPDLVPGPAVLAREHASTAELLSLTAPDALLLETFNTIREAVAASRAAAATGLPVIVSFACRSRGRLLSGEDAAAAATAVTGIGVTALGVNCTAIPHLAGALGRLRKGSDLPLVAYANNAWYAADSPWLRGGPLSPEEYGAAALRWCGLGARLVGGCCGTSPGHIAAVAQCLLGARLEWGCHADP